MEEGEKIFRLGLAADIGLAAGKALTGYVSGSTVIIADAAHSLSDVVLSGVALLSYKAAMVQGQRTPIWSLLICRGKFESLGALGISSVLSETGGVIAWHAFDILAPKSLTAAAAILFLAEALICCQDWLRTSEEMIDIKEDPEDLKQYEHLEKDELKSVGKLFEQFDLDD